MEIKNMIKSIGNSAGNKVAKLSKLSSEQVKEIQEEKEKYLFEKPSPNDELALEMTNKLIAASSIEIFNAYLKQIKDLYLPIDKNAQFDSKFVSDYNIRYFNITKWVTNKSENSIEKLINVYAVLSDEKCNIALVFNRTQKETNVYLAVVNTGNVGNSTDVKNYKERLAEAIKGNFPGAEIKNMASDEGVGLIPCLDNDKPYSIAIASNIPDEKSEKFISQTIEKLLDGIVPENNKQEYTIVLIASPIMNLEERKLKLAELYSGLAPYSSWSTNFQYTENKAIGASATAGINIGASAGIQNGQTNSTAGTSSETESSSDALGSSSSQTNSNSYNESIDGRVNVGIIGGIGTSSGNTQSFANLVGKSVTNTLGKAISKSASVASGVVHATNLGANFGANFSRASTVTAIIGKNEGITQSFENYNIKHALQILEKQMKRLDQSSALGMWDFAAYVLSEDSNIANNVAHSYLALTQGEESYNSQSAINLWKGNLVEEHEITKEIVDYVRELRHPSFALNKEIIEQDKTFNYYPSIITPTTSLSGKELAYSLNFPQKSIAGLPVLECAEFGRNIVKYDNSIDTENKCNIGKIYHMKNIEKNPVQLDNNSLTSHTFITGSTGAGKSNTIYNILSNLKKQNVKFLVIEPAKGEYKNVFGNCDDVKVYGTNPNLTELLRINPFSFPKGIHVLEHMDRLVEIFNVCWPMYAAMPAVLKDAIEKAYIDCGWDMITSTNKYNENLYPTFIDVFKNVKLIIDSSDFDADNKVAYKGALLIRLQSLTNGIIGLIFTTNELSNEELFDSNTIVDLSRIGSSETKSLLMGMLVLKLQEYRMTSDVMNSDLKHITVLEEAHNLLKKTSTEQSSESANLVGKSVEMLTNAIAEMRTYGEGFIISDNSPGLLDTAVIRNTNTKIIMRLPEYSDRELVGKSANLNNEQIVELAKLPKGVAAVYQNEWVQPVLCKIDKYMYDEDFRYINPCTNCNEYAKDDEIKKDILNCLMNDVLPESRDKSKLNELKESIAKSKISAKVKADILEYIECEKNDEFEKLQILLYDFLSSEDAIDFATNCDDTRLFVQNVVKKLEPKIDNYSDKQINLALCLILREKSMQDVRYLKLFNDFWNIYEEKGRVY